MDHRDDSQIFCWQLFDVFFLSPVALLDGAYAVHTMPMQSRKSYKDVYFGMREIYCYISFLAPTRSSGSHSVCLSVIMLNF